MTTLGKRQASTSVDDSLNRKITKLSKVNDENTDPSISSGKRSKTRSLSHGQNAFEWSSGSNAVSLTLSDGSSFEGFSFGAEKSICGEVVFNTGMVGYPEALTDPSYAGQVLILTYPLVGNYGVPDEEDIDELGMPTHFESKKIQIRGLVVMDYSFEHSHWNSKSSLSAWLRRHDVPAIFGVDTRLLTKKIREHGVMLGSIQFPHHPIVTLVDPNAENLVKSVSTTTISTYNEKGKCSIIAFDCGMKFNIVRYFVNECNVKVIVVPFDYDLEKNPAGIKYDGIFISNGPGDPQMAMATVTSIKWALNLEPPVPIFGICLGNQILALATGAKTFKMKYGNRGMNQPCIDMRTGRCYITPQNHGFAVDPETLSSYWRPLFINANDMTNEGIIHESKPFFSVQFHPEACGGPTTRNEGPSENIYYGYIVTRKVLLIGSGGLSIGQAGEFDYSGSQAIKALKEEGIEVVLINPNIATVQTSKGLADHVYFLPVKRKFVLDVIEKEKPDSILVSMGGQTALNVGVEMWRAGDLKRLGIRVLGTQIDAIMATEDRDVFAQKLSEINEKAARSMAAETVADAVKVAAEIGYPVLVRAAYALGGLGSGFAENETELRTLVKKAFSTSSQVIIDQDLRGWKEVEYEVVRDCNDNCVTVCNMENFDPLGVHTGDSIVVAPSQTLSNAEYMKLREVAIKVVRHLGVVGECNIQYALDPKSERYCIIEVNARLSRSSALASKATGYPLAYVAAKLALGKDLVAIRNSVTRTTTACFEPSLDYVVVKMPRWDLKKFSRVDQSIGSAMKSVGEVMAIGRKFEEVFQKALRMVDGACTGFGSKRSLEAIESQTKESLEYALKNPCPRRVYHLASAFQRGYTLERLHELTHIDRWFLSKLRNIHQMGAALSNRSLNSLTAGEFKLLKCHGFSDPHIAELVGITNQSGLDGCGPNGGSTVRTARKALGIIPYVKQIDTLAAEFPAQTNYLYMTYNGSENDLTFNDGGVVVLGCGAYCIGSSVEFDWCAVSCVREIRAQKKEAIVINFNPETVSTDYDESDRLYFEELSLERVLDIYELETAEGVVVSVGGQIPNNLSTPLHTNGCTVLGTPVECIDRAEDRNKFSAMLDEICVDQPRWASLTSIDAARTFCAEVGYPVLVRPSYVLSGAAMRVASNWDQMSEFMSNAGEISPDYPVVVSEFINGAKEIEFDGVANNGEILNYAISEHVENAGVHSGDATLLLPSQKLYTQTKRQVQRIAKKIAKALNISGPFNIQLMARSNDLKVIECNLRASRTFPFISKCFDLNFIALATRVMLGLPVKRVNVNENDLDFVGCKAPQFSFTRLQGADPTTGVEMSSTGEVACFGVDTYQAFLMAIMSAGFKLPANGGKGSNVCLSIGPKDGKKEVVQCARTLVELGYNVYATSGTAAFLKDHGIPSQVVRRPMPELHEGRSESMDDCVSEEGGSGNVLDLIKDNKFTLVVVIPNATSKYSSSSGYKMRRAAVDFSVPLIVNMKVMTLLCQSLKKVKKFDIVSMAEFHSKHRL